MVPVKSVLDDTPTNDGNHFGGVIADSPIISQVEFYAFATPGAVVIDNLIWEEFQGGGDVPASSPLALLVLLAILMTVSWAILRPKWGARHST